MARMRILTVEEAKRGIYIDFEGLKRDGDNKLPQPHMLGAWSKEGRGVVFLLRDWFKPMVGSPIIKKRWGECQITCMNTAMTQLIQRSEIENRLLLSYSEHELRVINKYCDSGVATRFKAHYFDVRPMIKNWRNKFHGGKKPEGNTLKGYFDLIGYSHNPELDVKPATDLRAIEKAATKTKSWRRFDSIIRNKWTSLVIYNFHDCKGMFKLTKKAANRFAS